MTDKEKLQKAIEIFKARLPEATGKFQAHVSVVNENEVEVFTEDSYYCTINIKTRKIKGIRRHDDT